MKTQTYKTPHNIVVEGFAVLVERLGAGGALQFFHQYETGRGNYTKERKQILKQVTLATLRKQLLRPKR